MSFWTKIRGPLELAAGAAAAYFVGPEVLAAFGSSGGAAAATEAAGAGIGADAAAVYAAPAMATDAESAGMGALFAENPAPAFDAGTLSGALKSSAPYISPAVQGVGALTAGGLAYSGQQQTNAANAQQAQQQEAFQAQMSNTAYQRATADMKAAGLNPMLAYSQGGATTPGGAQAVMGNAAGAGVSSATQALDTMGRIQNQFAQGDLINAEAQKTRADTLNAYLQGPKIEAETGQAVSSSRQAAMAAAATEAGIKGILADSDVKENTVGSRTSSAASDAQYLAFKARLAGLGVNEAQSYSDFWATPAGQRKPLADHVMNLGSSAAQAAGSLSKYLLR